MAAHAHQHAPDLSHPSPKSASRRLLQTVGITASIMLAEALGGLISGSLALLADAAHMLFDVLALLVALGAQQIGQRPADPRRTYGYRRFEVLGALFNGVLLVVTSIVIAYEATQRVLHPAPIGVGAMEAVAVLGLVANVVSAQILKGGHHDLNVRGALWHVLADLLSSAAVVLGGILIALTGWLWLDPVLSLLIAAIIVAGAWRMLKEVVDVLLEAVPPHLSAEAIRLAIAGCNDVIGVHDLHVWSITSNLVALSAHVVVGAHSPDSSQARRDVAAMLAERFQIRHVTLQIESRAELDLKVGACGCG